jgi:hypothetical protein
MTTTAAPTPALRAHEVTVAVHQRAHRRDVIRWALAHGRPLHRDALAGIVGARAQALGGSGTLAATVDVSRSSVWSATDIGALLWVGMADWCGTHGAQLPPADQVSTTLLTYLRYLSAHRLLARGSDPVADLRRAVDEYGGTGGRSRRHPSMGARPSAPVLPLA